MLIALLLLGLLCVVLLFVPYLPALQDELARRRKPPE